MSALAPSSTRVAHRLTVHGRVQGLGARPAVVRLAAELKLTGCVRNSLDGLQIEIEGEPGKVAQFRTKLRSALPVGSQIDQIESHEIGPGSHVDFRILECDAEGPLTTPVPLDQRICDACVAEAATPDDRRVDYALISCASCGPRYSVISAMPYERAQTTLAGFPLCGPCAGEYASPADRRFHAQSTACPTCGPQVWAADRSGRTTAAGEAVIDAAVAVLRSGGNVALRGIGGYQLLCDAADESAVARLRLLKRRPAKPFAVLVADMVDAGRIARLSNAERRTLADSSNPIVLLQSRESELIAPAVHPGFHTLGVMLPATMLHHQLARQFARPLVCTSGNREGDPLEHEPAAAERNLSGIADLWLHHDRPIARPIDDSVVRIIAGRPVTLRAARGFAPLTLELPPGRPLLAVGAHQKSAVAWCNGAQCTLGPHIGDLETLPARERWLSHRADIEQLYRFRPEAVAHDRHPGYVTTRWVAESGLPPVPIQHHQAHVAAGMVEHGLLTERVLGVAWDGTGLGTDGAIWGGEFLIADGLTAMRRVAHMRPFRLIGGEAAVREPWRVAAALLSESIGRDELERCGIKGVEPAELRRLLDVAERPHLHPLTTSAGRLFDAAACLILSITHAPFDGAPAMLLEAIADPVEAGCYTFPLIGGSPVQLDWRPLIAAIWTDLRQGVALAVIATRFHRTLARGIADVISLHPPLPVVLSGGVFQNRLLTELLLEELHDNARLKLPGRIPPNDGGIAAGQLAISLETLRHGA